MAANSWGSRFVVTTFGESHGKALGVVIDGCPAQVPFDEDLLKMNLRRRRPGAHGSETNLVSSRQEEDHPDILSGIYEGKTLGTPVAVTIANRDQRPQDYKEIEKSPRPGHADDVWKNKFGHVDPRGGGRASGRETVCRVVAGSIAQMYLRAVSSETQVIGFVSKVGSVEMTPSEVVRFGQKVKDPSEVDQCVARLPVKEKAEQVQEMLLAAVAEGKSYGGVAQIVIKSPPPNLGQPVFHKLKVDLTAALMSVGAVCGVEVGDALLAREAEGSQFHRDSGQQQYGGIRGGISTGEDIFLKVSFKPTATVLDAAKKGRHDPCVVPRAIPVLEAMIYMVLAEHYLWSLTDKI